MLVQYTLVAAGGVVDAAVSQGCTMARCNKNEQGERGNDTFPHGDVEFVPV